MFSWEFLKELSYLLFIFETSLGSQKLFLRSEDFPRSFYSLADNLMESLGLFTCSGVIRSFLRLFSILSKIRSHSRREFLRFSLKTHGIFHFFTWFEVSFLVRILKGTMIFLIFYRRCTKNMNFGRYGFRKNEFRKNGFRNNGFEKMFFREKPFRILT